MAELYGEFPPGWERGAPLDTWGIRCARCGKWRIAVTYYARSHPVYCLGCLYGWTEPTPGAAFGSV